jgi:hypothetical protein
MTQHLPTLRALAIQDVEDELDAAMTHWPPMNSAHEGYGVLAEEFRELETIVFQKQKNRNLEDLRKEAKQVAAMAIRFMIEICNEERGRK